MACRRRLPFSRLDVGVSVVAACRPPVDRRRRGGGAVELQVVAQVPEEVLDELANGEDDTPVVLSMLFLSPGRHAGRGGDITSIRDRVVAANPSLQAVITPLIGEHPGLVTILKQRLENAL